MHLGIYHEPVHTDGTTYDTYGPFARYVLEFARNFEHVTVFAPTTDQPTYFSGTPIDAPNITVVPLPFFQTHIQAAMSLPKIWRAFAGNCDKLDVINARGTAPFAYLLNRMTRKRGVPFIYHFASDPFEVIARNAKYRGPRGLFAKKAYGVEFTIQKSIMRRNYSFASGRAICERLEKVTDKVEAIVDSTLAEEDFYLRDDSCTSEPVRILYVGYLRHGKGLEDLIEAMGILCEAGRAVELELVGSGEMKDQLQKRADELGILDKIDFRGHLTMGPELNARYDGADIFALPSLSEGSPRVVLEAMGHSLPVIATDVGNVSETLEAGRRGVLIPCDDPQAIADAVCRLIDDGQFRRHCIAEGFAFARTRGVEAFVGRMSQKAREMVTERQKGND